MGKDKIIIDGRDISQYDRYIKEDTSSNMIILRGDYLNEDPWYGGDPWYEDSACAKNENYISKRYYFQSLQEDKHFTHGYRTTLVSLQLKAREGKINDR